MRQKISMGERFDHALVTVALMLSSSPFVALSHWLLSKSSKEKLYKGDEGLPPLRLHKLKQLTKEDVSQDSKRLKVS